MNILYICADRGIPIRGHKGAAVHVRALTNAFARAGHTVTIVTPRPGPENGLTPKARIQTIPLPDLPGHFKSEEEARARQSLLYTDHLVNSLQEEIANNHYDFIYERYSLWSDAGARLSQITGLPLILEVNAPLIEEASRYRYLTDYTTAARIEAAQFQTARVISVVSEQLRAYVTSRNVAAEKVHVLPNGVDPILFHPAVRGGRIHARYGLNGHLIVGFVGRPRPWHDLDTLLRAMVQLKAVDSRFHLLLVGQMPPELPARLKELGLSEQTTLTGPVPHEEIPEYIAAMDVAVSTHRAMVNFYFSPLKLFEYMACGVPVVAADVGQPSRVIQNGITGYLYPPGNDRVLAERICMLVDNPAHARQIAWQAASIVLHQYTWDRNVRRILEWTTAVSPTPPSRPMPNTIQLPILDQKLRQRLYRATRTDLALPLLARRLPAFWKKGPEKLDAITNIQVLKYKPNRRCVLLYELRGHTKKHLLPTRHRVVGKLFRDERGRRLLHLQQWLWENGFGPETEDQIHVPQPLAYIPEMRMMVQAWTPGQTLNEMVLTTGLHTHIIRAAQALARFHSVNLSAQFTHGPKQFLRKPYLLSDEQANLTRFAQNLCAMKPEKAAEILLVHDALQRWAANLPPLLSPSLVHRDFYYSQLLFHHGRVTLIDFDLAAPGDPAIDVANFVAHLHFLGLYRLCHADALTHEASVFLDVYGRLRPPDDGFWQRFAFYRAATFFRLLHVVLPRPGLAHHFDTLFRLTQNAIAAQSYAVGVMV